MEIPFGTSRRSDIGIEWELACVDRESGELSDSGSQILEAMGASETDGYPQVTAELLTNTVEVVSGPHVLVKHAVGDLAAMIARARAVADPLGVDFMCSGTHPFSEWKSQHVTPYHKRYETFIDRTQWWGRQMLIWGVHMHIGVDDRE